MQVQITQALHNSAIGGRYGFYTTYRRIKKLFSWPGLTKFVQQWVQGCVVYQQATGERVIFPRLQQPLKVPSGAWEVVTMDFVDGPAKFVG